CAAEKVGSTTAQGVPGPVTGITNNRLNQQSREWRSQPQHCQLGFFGAEVLVNGAHVGHLQAPAKLDPEEAEAHVPDLPEGQARLLHSGWERLQKETNGTKRKS